MCTVTYIPVKDKLFLTSNRDEKQWRRDAAIPAVYAYETGKILFPKDADAGGTWIAVHENGNAIVLLNGGFLAHTPEPPYRKSRGLILLDLIKGATPYNSFLAVRLTGIESFTAIVWDNHHLFECRWDGKQKHSKQLNQELPYIWSSVTLYDDAVIRKRSQWFETWINQNRRPTIQDIMHFHQFTGDGDSNNDLRMNRNGAIFTVSVTSLAISSTNASMQYVDLKNDLQTEGYLTLAKTILSR